MRKYINLIIIILFFAVCRSEAENAIDVGNVKQLFIDHTFIERARNVHLVVNPPIKAGIAIKRDKPWESAAISGCVVIQEANMVRAYYDAVEFTEPNTYGKSYPCYAESDDGINWRKPNLGLVEYRGSKENNILQQAGDIFIDPRASADKKYKLLALCGSWTDCNTAGLYLFHSADGIRWEKNENRLFPFWPDGTNQIVYEPATKKYIVYFRQWLPRSPGTIYDSRKKPLRTQGMLVLDAADMPWPFDAEVQKFHLWGADIIPTPSVGFATALACDANDPPETDIYCACISRYEWASNVWVAFPALYRHFPDPCDKFINDGLVDVQLAVSRDGIGWIRYRQPYLPLGLAGTQDSRQIYAGTGLVRKGDEIYQYYTGSPLSHGEFPNHPGYSEMFRAVQRLDGFVSADAPYEGGVLITPLIVFSGNKLEINVNTSAAGQVQVELLNQDNQPVKGFTAADADLVQGNFIRKTVSWRDSSDVGSLIKKPIKLRFAMRSAKLYSFQFTGGINAK